MWIKTRGTHTIFGKCTIWIIAYCTHCLQNKQIVKYNVAVTCILFGLLPGHLSCSKWASFNKSFLPLQVLSHLSIANDEDNKNQGTFIACNI